jgi:L-ascorbate metabolism protein UlaG (beta-lactamase superfamily)
MVEVLHRAGFRQHCCRLSSRRYAVIEGRRLVPIHYGTFNNPPVYIERSNIAEHLAAAAERERVRINLVPENREI